MTAVGLVSSTEGGYHTRPADPQCIVAGCLWQRPEREDHGVLDTEAFGKLFVVLMKYGFIRLMEEHRLTNQFIARVDSEKVPLKQKGFIDLCILFYT